MSDSGRTIGQPREQQYLDPRTGKPTVEIPQPPPTAGRDRCRDAQEDGTCLNHPDGCPDRLRERCEHLQAENATLRRQLADLQSLLGYSATVHYDRARAAYREATGEDGNLGPIFVWLESHNRELRQQLAAVTDERDALAAWKATEQQALVKSSVILLNAGYKGDGVSDGVEWLAAALTALAAEVRGLSNRPGSTPRDIERAALAPEKPNG